MLFKFILNVCCFDCTFVQKLFKSACFPFAYKFFHSMTPLFHCTADHSHLSATYRCALREALYKLIDTIQYLSHSSSGVRHCFQRSRGNFLLVWTLPSPKFVSFIRKKTNDC